MIYSKQYNKIDNLHLIVVPQLAGDITTQPKQGRLAAPMSSLFIFYGSEY